MQGLVSGLGRVDKSPLELLHVLLLRPMNADR